MSRRRAGPGAPRLARPARPLAAAGGRRRSGISGRDGQSNALRPGGAPFEAAPGGAPGPHDLVVGPWGARFRGRRLPCAVGRGGILPAAAKREGDGATPAGRWRLLGLYWRADRGPRPRTRLAALPLGPRQGWAEDPADPAYNRPVRHPHGFPADRMARGDGLYDLCAVTDHNAAPVVPGAGSAIFVHRWRKPRHPTAGCVAFRPDHLAWILARWTPRARLVVRPGGGL